MKRGKLAQRLFSLSLYSITAYAIWMIQFPAVSRAEGPRQKRVLALYWYGKDFPANVEFDRGVQSVFRRAGIEYYAEYWEPNRFPGEAQALTERDYLKRKYAEREIDAVIAMSVVSADFLLKYRDDLFPDVPIVFHTNTLNQLYERASGINATGVVPDEVHARTLDAALRFHPDTKQVFVINGTIEQDKSVEVFLKEQLHRFEGKV